MNIWAYMKAWHGGEIIEKKEVRKVLMDAFSKVFEARHSDSGKAIEILRNLTEVKVYNPGNYFQRRKKFNRKKWAYLKSWTQCKVCKQFPTQHIHHAVLLKNGGTNDEANLIALCKGCHAMVHDWMEAPDEYLHGDKISQEYKQVLS